MFIRMNKFLLEKKIIITKRALFVDLLNWKLKKKNLISFYWKIRTIKNFDVAFFWVFIFYENLARAARSPRPAPPRPAKLAARPCPCQDYPPLVFCIFFFLWRFWVDHFWVEKKKFSFLHRDGRMKKKKVSPQPGKKNTNRVAGWTIRKKYEHAYSPKRSILLVKKKFSPAWWASWKNEEEKSFPQPEKKNTNRVQDGP